MTRPNARDITVSEAICEAIGQEMEANEMVLVLGEDVGVYGGVFGATDGLMARFGPDRVRDTPISETAFTGMGVGLAMAGYRPVVEIMFADFIGVCLEQIYNAMAKIPYMSGGNTRIPMVLKTAGGCIGAAAQHSQCLWGTFAHLPGMRVVVPSCPENAKGLMTAALRSDDPIVYIEHKALMRRKTSAFRHGGAVSEDAYAVALDRGEVVREGGDLTVITLAKGVEDALAAAGELEAEGIDIELVNLLSVVPLDVETICGSVAKTGRVLVVDEDYLSFGLSGEILARLLEQLGPGALKQVARHATPDVPIPAAITLEEAVIPSAGSIAREIRALAARS